MWRFVNSLVASKCSNRIDGLNVRTTGEIVLLCELRLAKLCVAVRVCRLADRRPAGDVGSGLTCGVHPSRAFAKTSGSQHARSPG